MEIQLQGKTEWIWWITPFAELLRHAVQLLLNCFCVGVSMQLHAAATKLVVAARGNSKESEKGSVRRQRRKFCKIYVQRKNISSNKRAIENVNTDKREMLIGANS